MQTEVEDLPSMEQLLGQHVKLKAVKKIGEGTFGEAFKGGDMVFKIVPMEGSLLVSLPSAFQGSLWHMVCRLQGQVYVWG